MKKTFDCVEMKRSAQERIYETLRGMTAEEERQYWRERGEELKRLREERLKAKSALAGAPPAK